MYPTNKQQVETQVDKPEPKASKSRLSKRASVKCSQVDNLLDGPQGPELVPKFSNQTSYQQNKKVSKKMESCPRNRRRSRQDRNSSKSKNNQQQFKDLGPGTTIIVIQKNDEEEDGEYSSKQIENFESLDEEIQKIKHKNYSTNIKQHYRSENRAAKKSNMATQPCQNEQKGKPPLKTTSVDPHKGSGIPKIGERKTPTKAKGFSKTTRLRHKNMSQKSSRTGSIDSESQGKKMKKESSRAALKHKYKKENPAECEPKNIDDLIQGKRDAMGIKPLESALSNYKTVLNENNKLQKLVEEQKTRIKKMREERAQQFKEITKIKEDNKKLETMVKAETPAKARQIRSSYRVNTRDNSNTSIGQKAGTKSPSYRNGKDYTKSAGVPRKEPEKYELHKSDTVKRINTKRNKQQPKIGGKEHSEIISTELLRQSTKELMQHSFSNFKEIEKIYKMEKYDDNFETSFSNKELQRKKSTKAHSFLQKTPTKTTSKSSTNKMSLKMGKSNEAYQFSPNAKLNEVKEESDSKSKNKKNLRSNLDKIKFHPPSPEKNSDSESLEDRVAEHTTNLLK